MLDTIFLIVGKSGSGKSTLAAQLETISQLKSIPSYTTRPPRYDGEPGHIFVGSYSYWNRRHPNETLVGFTIYKGFEYWATSTQADECDLYVIDPKGIEFFRRHYRGNKQVKIVYIDADPWERYERMRQRGDSRWEALSRIWRDHKWFKGWRDKADYVIDNYDLAESFTKLNDYINSHRRYLSFDREKDCRKI